MTFNLFDTVRLKEDIALDDEAKAWLTDKTSELPVKQGV